MSSYHTPPNDAKNPPATPLAGSPTEPLQGSPALPRTADGLSTTVEDLFFSYPEMTPAQWQRCLDTRTVGPLSLADDTVAELRILVAELEDVTAATEPAGQEGDQPKAVQTLNVAGRQGASYQLLDHLGTGGHSVVYRGLQAEPFERVVAIKVYYKTAELRACSTLRPPAPCSPGRTAGFQSMRVSGSRSSTAMCRVPFGVSSTCCDTAHGPPSRFIGSP